MDNVFVGQTVIGQTTPGAVWIPVGFEISSSAAQTIAIKKAAIATMMYGFFIFCLKGN